MALTVDDERIIKLIIDELRTRKKLDAARSLRDVDLRAGISEVQGQVEAEHSESIAILQAAFDAAELSIKNEFA